MIDICKQPDFMTIIGNDGILNENALHGVSVNCIAEGAALKISLATTIPIKYVILRWRGALTPSTRILGDSVERAYGNLSFCGIIPERLMAWYCIMTDGSNHDGYGVKVRPNCFAYWTADEKGISLRLDVRCGAVGLSTQGKELFLAEAVSDTEKADEDVFFFMKKFCQKMSDAPVLPKKPVYGFNNWYYAYGNSSEKQILCDSDLLCTLTDKLENRPYMVIDDGWQRGSTHGQCTGTIGSATNLKFPNMKRLSDAISAKGLLPGIWIRPLKWNLFPSHPSLSLQGRPFSADPSLPKVLEKTAADLQKLTAEWGYRLVKFDFATFDVLKRFIPKNEDMLFEGNWSLKNKMTNAQAIKGLYKTILDNSNGAIIIGCNCVSHLGAGYFHLHRSGDDTSGRNWERTRYYGVNTLAFRMAQHKAFFDIDADCVGITEKIDPIRNAEWLRLLSRSGTPLFVSAKPSAVTNEIREQLREAFALSSVQKDVCVPLGLTDTSMPTRYLINGEETTFDFTGNTGVLSYNRR